MQRIHCWLVTAIVHETLLCVPYFPILNKIDGIEQNFHAGFQPFYEFWCLNKRAFQMRQTISRGIIDFVSQIILYMILNLDLWFVRVMTETAGTWCNDTVKLTGDFAECLWLKVDTQMLLSVPPAAVVFMDVNSRIKDVLCFNTPLFVEWDIILIRCWMSYNSHYGIITCHLSVLAIQSFGLAIFTPSEEHFQIAWCLWNKIIYLQVHKL